MNRREFQAIIESVCREMELAAPPNRGYVLSVKEALSSIHRDSWMEAPIDYIFRTYRIIPDCWDIWSDERFHLWLLFANSSEPLTCVLLLPVNESKRLENWFADPNEEREFECHYRVYANDAREDWVSMIQAFQKGIGKAVSQSNDVTFKISQFKNQQNIY